MHTFKTTISNFYKAVRESALAISEVRTFSWGSPYDFEQITNSELAPFVFAEWNGGSQNRELGNTKIVTLYFLVPDFMGNSPEALSYDDSDLPARDKLLIEAEYLADKFFDSITDWIKANPTSNLSISPVANITPELLAFTATTSGYASTYQITLGKTGCEEFRPFTTKNNDCKKC